MTGRALRRDWGGVTLESFCAVCAGNRWLQRAHLIGRARDRRVGPKLAQVAANEVVTLCQRCHSAYDAHRLDLYPHLTADKLRGAVRAAGSPGEALRRLMGADWRTAPEQTITTRLERMEELNA